MPQTIETINPVLSGPDSQLAIVRPIKTGKVAIEARASVDKIVALNANLLAAA